MKCLFLSGHEKCGSKGQAHRFINVKARVRAGGKQARGVYATFAMKSTVKLDDCLEHPLGLISQQGCFNATKTF